MSIKTSKRLKHYPYGKLKGLLAEKGIRQRQIAELLNLSPVTVNQKINGTLNFSYDEAEIICDLLGVSTDILRGQKVS